MGHPLIHLGYAYELSNKELAMEALGLATTSYNYLHKYLDDTAYTKPSTYSTTSLLEILGKVADDKRLDGFLAKGVGDVPKSLFQAHEEFVLEHWNAWDIIDPKKQFADSQAAATALLVATHESPGDLYDFFLVHLLTSSHAVRILLPFVPAKFHVNLIRQWWFLALTVYISQGRPPIKLVRITEYPLNDVDWNKIDKRALKNDSSIDAHYVKALRAMKEAAGTWGDKDQFYLKAATRFGDEFNGWGGFGP